MVAPRPPGREIQLTGALVGAPAVRAESYSARRSPAAMVLATHRFLYGQSSRTVAPAYGALPAIDRARRPCPWRKDRTRGAGCDRSEGRHVGCGGRSRSPAAAERLRHQRRPLDLWQPGSDADRPGSCSGVRLVPCKPRVHRNRAKQPDDVGRRDARAQGYRDSRHEPSGRTGPLPRHPAAHHRSGQVLAVERELRARAD